MFDRDVTALGPVMAELVECNRPLAGGDPSPALRLRRGIAYGAARDHRAALAELAVAVTGDLSEEDLAAAHRRRAVLLCRLGEHAQAEIAATRSLAVRLTAAGYTARAMPRCLGGDLQGAWADTERALLLDPSYPGGHAVRGRVFLALGRPADALADFDVSTRAEAYDGDARIDRAECLLILGEPARAVAACGSTLCGCTCCAPAPTWLRATRSPPWPTASAPPRRRRIPPRCTRSARRPTRRPTAPATRPPTWPERPNSAPHEM
ncbi:tetratricopeptide repeat protein [Herbidospora yilanensis]|uniref:tetratricopeptide repeat protein n=1 Tax=Herbidospora yilanensis TaxID=354426 RepID=UPI0007828EAD|nr:hypothetical protein [Herbidospora yilanensis]